MKIIWLIMLGGLLMFGFIYHMNKVAPEPMPGLPGSGQPVSSQPSTDSYEPLILNSKTDFSFISKAYAETVDASDLAQVSEKTIQKTDVRSMGAATAPIKIYIFSSLTCGHCAAFHTHTIPRLKKDYVDTGIAQLTYIDFPFDRRAVAGAMLARCVKPENYFTFLEVLFENQDKWAFEEKAEEIVMNYAALEGMSKGDVKACLADTQLLQKIVSDRDFYMKKYHIQGTPTTVIIKGTQTEVIGGADETALRAILDRMK